MNKVASRTALADTLIQLAGEDSRIVVVTSDATGSAALSGFRAQFPERLIEVGIAEQNEISVAAGLSNGGLIPFVCAPAAFISFRAFEQVKLDMGYSGSNVKAIGISGGLSYGSSGLTHFAVSDLANMTAVENLTVLLPSDAVEMAALTRIMLDSYGPFYVRVGRNPIPVIYGEGETFEIGKCKRVREGTDITICAAGEVLWRAIEAADALAEDGIHARVLDMFSIKPIDRQAIVCAAKETGRILVVEEHTVTGGLGSQVAQITAEACPVPVKCIGIPNEHFDIGSEEAMLSALGFSRENIVNQAKAMLV